MIVLFLVVIGMLVWLLVEIRSAGARDFGQWENTDPAIRRWYRDLDAADNPAVSCCGEADAYWADAFESNEKGEYVAIITDPRPDEPLHRKHQDIGTKIVVPKTN